MNLLPTTTISQPDANGPNVPDTQYSQLVRDIYALLLRDPRYNIPPYDTWEPKIIGGLTGVYSLNCPFDSNAEYRVLYLTTSDTATAYIGPLANFPVPTSTTNIGGDPTQPTPTPDFGVTGTVLSATANFTTLGPDEWLPFGPQDTLYVRLTVATSHAAWVGVLFRRRRQPSGVWTEGA